MTLAFALSSIFAVILFFVALPGMLSWSYEQRVKTLTNVLAVLMVGATVVGCVLAVL